MPCHANSRTSVILKNFQFILLIPRRELDEDEMKGLMEKEGKSKGERRELTEGAGYYILCGLCMYGLTFSIKHIYASSKIICNFCV